ncbi:MAG: flagellar biosynthesis protein FlhB [Gammaproteobacteria bacterium]|nr:flagellar biosynthesis protein FlhB [Gammaproteobacteria bacterium]
MADNSSDQEKTEQPSAKRLLDAKKKGQVPRSRELNITIASLGGGLLFLFSLGEIQKSIESVFNKSYVITSRSMLSNDYILDLFGATFKEVLMSFSFMFFFLMIIVVAGPALIGGWSFSLSSMSFKISKLSPMSGFKRMFGMNGLIELIKSIMKVILVATIAFTFLKSNQNEFLALAGEQHDKAVVHSVSIVVSSYLYIALGLIVIVGIDVPYQLWNHKKQLKMSLQELKDEYKETEGNPESKARTRNLQKEISQRKMLQEVPNADVIIVNPTHFSVALRYDTSKDAAPILVAKGVDNVALKIREIATGHNIPVFTAPLLARAIYHTTDLEKEVDSDLYIAVAKVLAYVFQLKDAKPGNYPKPPTDLTIPKEYRAY